MMKYLLILAIMVSGTLLMAQPEKIYSAGEGELAFEGYDLTTYENGSEPLLGSERYSYWHDGRVFQFVSEENLKKFKARPDDYLPAYGGWCATAMAQGFTAKPNYKMFEIQNGELLFFEVKAFFNGKTQWQKNPEGYTIKAAENYNKIKSKQ